MAIGRDDDGFDDDQDGVEWALGYTNATPETQLDPTLAAIHPESNLDEQGYPSDWKAVAARRRAVRDFACEECRVSLREFPWLLHVHHLDRDKSNCDDINLRVLCLLCHSMPDDHAHLRARIHEDDRQLVEAMRADQQFVADPAAPRPTSRKEATLGSYNLIAAFVADGFKGRAAALKDHLDDIRVAASTLEGAWAKLYYSAMLANRRDIRIRHQRFVGLGATATLRLARYPRKARCYRCRTEVDNAVDFECEACAWIVCGDCAACGCGFMRQ